MFKIRSQSEKEEAKLHVINAPPPPFNPLGKVRDEERREINLANPH